MRRNKNARSGFALYEVLLGLAIFVIGVLVLGRSVENCLNASQLSEEENRVRQLLANRMAEIQASPVHPDVKKEEKINTGYGIVRLIQKSAPQEFEEPDNTIITRDYSSDAERRLVARRGEAEQTARFLCLSCGLIAAGDALLPCSRLRWQWRFSA